MSNINKMITAAKEGNPNAFATAFRAETFSRIADAIALKRSEVVSNMFNTPGSNG